MHKSVQSSCNHIDFTLGSYNWKDKICRREKNHSGKHISFTNRFWWLDEVNNV